MIILSLLLLGLCFGSFINALIWRIHKQDFSTSKKIKQEYSIAHGRSMCMHCHHTLEPVDLIPIVSFVLLRGKCRYCSHVIPDTPVSEVITPILFIVSYLYWPIPFDIEGKLLFGFWLIYLVGFIALALYDLRWYILPNRIVFPLMYIVAVQVALQILFFHLSFSEIALLLGSIGIGGGIFYILFQLSNGKWIGGGDVKLGFLIGAILADPALSVLYIFVASLIGTIVSLPLLLTGRAKRTSHLPFGPFLIVSAIIVRLFGAGIIVWYKNQIGL